MRVAIPTTLPFGLARPRAARQHAVTCQAHPQAVNAVDGEGPGTGHRHTPFELGQQVDARRAPGPADKFDMRSSKEMYDRFPEWVHSGQPAGEIKDREPAGVAALHSADTGGPRSGKRLPPPPSVPRALASPRLPYPSFGPGADTKRDLLAKKRVVL
jgi:hypothetical protein